MRLLHYYESAANDPDWTKRLFLLSDTIQRVPSAILLGNPNTWRTMPEPFREQVNCAEAVKAESARMNRQVRVGRLYTRFD